MYVKSLFKPNAKIRVLIQCTYFTSSAHPPLVYLTAFQLGCTMTIARTLAIHNVRKPILKSQRNNHNVTLLHS